MRYLGVRGAVPDMSGGSLSRGRAAASRAASPRSHPRRANSRPTALATASPPSEPPRTRITGAGLPLLGVAAIGYSGSRDVQELASRVTPLYGLLFAVLLYLSIGPLFAIPRTATVSFEIGVVPFLGEPSESQRTWALAVFSIVFFAVSYWLAMSPGKLIDRIGKVLTPFLLLCIAVLVGASVLWPMGDFQAAQGEFVTQPLVKGFLEGYNTMDALASLVFAIIVIDSIRARGVSDKKALTSLTIRAGVLAAACLALVYALIAYMGASSVGLFGMLGNGAAVLSQVAQHYFGMSGNILLAAIVFLACLSTSVGLITSCAEYFNRIYTRALAILHRKWLKALIYLTKQLFWIYIRHANCRSKV